MNKNYICLSLAAAVFAAFFLPSTAFADPILDRVEMTSPEMAFETLVQVAEGRETLYIAAGECVYKNDDNDREKWKIAKQRNADTLKDLKGKKVSIFDGFHITPAGAARSALRQCLAETRRRGNLVGKIRFSNLQVNLLPKGPLLKIREKLKADLDAAGFKSCYPQVVDGLIQTVPSYCLPQRQIKNALMNTIRYTFYSALGAYAYRARGSGDPGGKAIWAITTIGVGFFEGGVEGAVAGAMLFAGSQMTPWGSGGGQCHDYGHMPDGKSKLRDSVVCGLGMFPVPDLWSAKVLERFGGYDTRTSYVSAYAVGAIYDVNWTVWDESKAYQESHPEGPGAISEYLTGAVRLPSFVRSVRSKKQAEVKKVFLKKRVVLSLDDRTTLDIQPIMAGQAAELKKTQIPVSKNLALQKMMINY